MIGQHVNRKSLFNFNLGHKPGLIVKMRRAGAEESKKMVFFEKEGCERA